MFKCKKWNFTFVLTLQTFLLYAESYNFECPPQASWKLRAYVMCNSTLKYFCLYNNVADKYVEGCNGPDWDRKGSKRIYAGDFSRDKCLHTRFQPLIFWTNSSMSDCIYSKSLCSDEGQIVYRDNSTKDDRACQCDYKKNFSFIKSPRNVYFCIPTEEDCSCYFKSCPVNLTLSSDYSCTQNGIKGNPNCIDITKFDKTLVEKEEKQRISSGKATSNFKWRYKTDTTILVFICIITIFVAGGFFLVVLFHEWTCEKLQPLERYFRRNHAAGEERQKEREHQPIKKSEQTTDEVNFLRMIHLLVRVACPVVRMIFNNEIKHDQLRKALDKNKLEMVKRYRKKEIIINDFQWGLLFGPDKAKTATSDNFDMRLMTYLLSTLANIEVGDLYPVQSDTRIGAMLSRIKFISNETTENLKGKLSGDLFNQYWDDIGQAVLKLVSFCQLNFENDQEKMRLIDRLLVLNPIHIDDKTLRIFIYMSERFPAMILQQLISEYCTFKQITIEDLLREVKHQLHHKRKKADTCCKCTTELSSNYKPISEKEWKALYEINKGSDVHFCKLNLRNCSESFVPKSINTGDLSVAKVLILNIPNILTYMISRLCVTGFDTFLMQNKHTLYHSMKKEMCCKCNKFSSKNTERSFINENEWNKLFIKDDIACQSSYRDCCCQYSVRNGTKQSDIDDTLLSKIFHVAGPVGILNKIEQDPLLYFLNWTVDAHPLRSALTELVNMIEDRKFSGSVLSFILPQSDDTIANQKDTRMWISKHLRQHQARTEQQIQILVCNEDGLNVTSVQIPKGFSLPLRTKKITDLTTEENNFLVVVYGLTKIVYPMIKNEFDTQCPDHVFGEIRAGIFEQQTASYRRNEKHNIRNKRIHLTQVQQQRLFSQTREELKNLDFELMVYILKKRSNNKWNREYINQLNGLDKIRREIVYSSSGILDHSKFNDILTRISEAVSYFGGEIYMKELSRLRHIQNILE